MMPRDRQFALLEKQKSRGIVRMQTMFLAMEEQLRNEAEALAALGAIQDCATRENVVATLRKAANFCGMHSFYHIGEEIDIGDLSV